MAERTSERGADDVEETARVAALVARAGLKLQVNEIVDLVAAYRKDRAGFERLREMLSPLDETAHTFHANSQSGRANSRSGTSAAGEPGPPG
jgi:hypothetical protein